MPKGDLQEMSRLTWKRMSVRPMNPASEAPALDGKRNHWPLVWKASRATKGRGPEGMRLPEFRLHELKGALKGPYAVSVSGDWRVTFRFEGGATVDVDYH